MTEASLSVTDLTVARGGRAVLEGLSFALQPGTALLLQGPNGIGKTSLLRCLAGLQPPLAGRIAAPPESLALATHADGVKTALSVAENLKFWAALYGRSDIAPALGAWDLADLSDRPAAALSAGQRRRLGLARMSVTGRAVWLMDEPTVSLDTATVRRFADTLRAHLAAGGSALIATHIDPGLDAGTLDLTPYRARPTADLFADDWT